MRLRVVAHARWQLLWDTHHAQNSARIHIAGVGQCVHRDDRIIFRCNIGHSTAHLRRIVRARDIHRQRAGRRCAVDICHLIGKQIADRNTVGQCIGQRVSVIQLVRPQTVRVHGQTSILTLNRHTGIFCDGIGIRDGSPADEVDLRDLDRGAI